MTRSRLVRKVRLADVERIERQKYPCCSEGIEMFDLLRILFCGVGTVYLVIRLTCFWRALARGRYLWPPVYEPARPKNHWDSYPAWERRDVPTQTAERTAVSSR